MVEKLVVCCSEVRKDASEVLLKQSLQQEVTCVREGWGRVVLPPLCGKGEIAMCYEAACLL